MGRPNSNPSSPKASRNKEDFRNYKDSARQDRVSQFYYLHHKYQTLEFAKKQNERFAKGEKQMSCWDAVLLLNELVDDSDPDTEQAQIVHLLQTGESLRKLYPGEEYDWLHLTGFIHDLGKVLAHPDLYNEPQWAVVGDTFPLGCQFDPSIVFPEYLIHNPDKNVQEYNTKNGIYEEGIGLGNLIMTWGHDEYLYQVCKRNNCTLPEQALFIIRFHSFYSWHQGGGYKHFMTKEDEKNLFWVKEFQKHDLYSKQPEKPNVEKLIPYYKGLINKYFPPTMTW
jgi:inositol oxygenase